MSGRSNDVGIFLDTQTRYNIGENMVYAVQSVASAIVDNGANNTVTATRVY